MGKNKASTKKERKGEKMVIYIPSKKSFSLEVQRKLLNFIYFNLNEEHEWHSQWCSYNVAGSLIL